MNLHIDVKKCYLNYVCVNNDRFSTCISKEKTVSTHSNKYKRHAEIALQKTIQEYENC